MVPDAACPVLTEAAAAAAPRGFGRAMPCSAAAQQRHKIIRNGVALVGEESVSGLTRGSRRGINQENPPMRIYIIGNDGITLCREAPVTVNEGEIAVASSEELNAAPLSGKRLLTLWNALPGVEKRRKVGDREALSISCGRRSRRCPTRSRNPTRSGHQSRTRSLRCCVDPRALRSTKSRAPPAGSATPCAASSQER